MRDKLLKMRFELSLKVKEQSGRELPCNYMYELSSWFYHTLNHGDAGFTEWLHNKGYCKEKKAFKLFTFSNLYIPRFEITGDRIRILSDNVRLVISFYPIATIEAFIIGLFKNRHFTLGDRTSSVAFEIISVEKSPEPVFSSTLCLKTLSPIFIEEQFPDSDKTNHLSPENPKFIELLHFNLLEKYQAFYNIEHNPFWPITQLRLLSAPKAKTITIKSGTPQETRVKGYMCRFELNGEPELLRIGYYGGFGRLNSQGFGCMEIIH